MGLDNLFIEIALKVLSYWNLNVFDLKENKKLTELKVLSYWNLNASEI